MKQRTVKKLQTFYQYMNFKGRHIDIAKDATSFYNKIVFYGHLFSFEFVNSSSFTISLIISWAPTETIPYRDRLIRDCSRRALPTPHRDSSSSGISFREAVLVAPLIASNDFHGSKNESEIQKLFWPYFLICPHGRATRGSLFVFTKADIQNFIA